MGNKKVKYTVNYDGGIVELPKSALSAMSRADATELKVLVCLCADGENADVEKLCELTGCGDGEVRDALAFWRGAGVITAAGKKSTKRDGTGTDAAQEARKADAKCDADRADTKGGSPKKLRAADELPNYTSNQLSGMLEQRQELLALIDECQNIVGKVLNVREINVIIGLTDYLELESEYIVTLLSHCVAMGKKTMHYVEKTAFGLYDEGICTAEQLSAELDRRERVTQIEGRIRSLFGLGGRAFTTKEKKFIAAWVGELGYGIDIIEKAYEVTADATGNASIPYANSVLERWNAEGLRTLEDIEESYQKKKAEGKAHEGSFDTDSFFEAAVLRSLGQN